MLQQSEQSYQSSFSLEFTPAEGSQRKPTSLYYARPRNHKSRSPLVSIHTLTYGYRSNQAPPFSRSTHQQPRLLFLIRCLMPVSVFSFLQKAFLKCLRPSDSRGVMERWQEEGYMCTHPGLVVEACAAPLQQRGVKYLAPGPFHGGC